MQQSKEERDAIIATVVAEVNANVKKLNSGPMAHTLKRRTALEKKASKRR